MVLSAHAIIGGAIGSIMKNDPILAVVYGFLSHFILDMIPHWDYPIRSKFINPDKANKSLNKLDIANDISSIFIDIVIGLGVSYLLYGGGGNLIWFYGACAAMLPDFLQFVYGLWPEGLSILQRFHKYAHSDLKLNDKPLLGVSSQIIIIFILVGISAFYGSIPLDKLDKLYSLEVKWFEPKSIKASELPTTSVLFTGDIMLGRNVEVLMEREGLVYPFLLINDFIKKHDKAIGNLEGTIRKNHVKTLAGEMSFSFPAITPQVLASSSIDAVSLGNNHSWDGGEVVYKETTKFLENSKIGYFGHPVYVATSTYIIKAGDRVINVVGFNATYPTFKLNEAKEIIKDIKKRQENIVIVYIHWGSEYELMANEYQRKIAKTLVDAGADAIIGHHPHVVENIEMINGVPVLYSLGNFVFDQYFSPEVEQGLLVTLEIKNSKNARLNLHPIQSKRSQPYLMEEKNSKEFLKDLAKRSDLSKTEKESVAEGNISFFLK